MGSAASLSYAERAHIISLQMEQKQLRERELALKLEEEEKRFLCISVHNDLRIC